jgi:hypothetical protein
MISVNLENNDDRKVSSRKRLETTLYLKTLEKRPIGTHHPKFFKFRDATMGLGRYCDEAL